MGAKLRNGNKGAHGGKRSGAGRKPNAFKEKCAEIADSPKFFKWAKGVIDGDINDVKVTKDGEVLSVPVSVYDRKELWKDMAAYGHGKPAQDVNHSGGVSVSLNEILDRAEEERGAT